MKLHELACIAALALVSVAAAAATPDSRSILVQAANSAIDSLGRPDGYYGNPEVQIPLPGKLEKVHKALQALGVNDKSEPLVLAMNRAAEAALPESRAMIVEAIQQMPLPDTQPAAGGGDVFTQQLRATMSERLNAELLPAVKRATQGVKLAEKYNEVASKASALGLLDQRDAALDEYVIRQALDGFFRTMAKHEAQLHAGK